MLARALHGALVSPRLTSAESNRAAIWSCNRNVGTSRRRLRRISAQSKNVGNEQNHQGSRQVSFSIYHNVQEGDTLTSIAKQYDTSVNTIAMVNKIDDVNMVQAGDVLMVPVQPKVFQKVTAMVMDLDGRSESSNAVISQTSPVSEPRLVGTVEVARTLARSGFWNAFTVPFVILAPIVVLVFRYLLQAAQNEIRLQVSRTQAQRDAWDAQHRPKVKRWQGILEGDRGAEETHSSPDSHTEEASATPETEEERKQREDEELRQSYAELEATYVKFLADSGLAKSGYWRGGMPSTDGDFG